MSEVDAADPGKYLSETQHESNLSSQLSTSPEILEQLRGYGIAENRSVRLEYFFFTNCLEKAAALSKVLSDMDYATEVQEPRSGNKVRVVAGSTAPVQMAKENVLEWTETMCNVGYEHDCQFDGWGISPEQ